MKKYILILPLILIVKANIKATGKELSDYNETPEQLSSCRTSTENFSSSLDNKEEALNAVTTRAELSYWKELSDQCNTLENYLENCLPLIMGINYNNPFAREATFNNNIAMYTACGAAQSNNKCFACKRLNDLPEVDY